MNNLTDSSTSNQPCNILWIAVNQSIGHFRFNSTSGYDFVQLRLNWLKIALTRPAFKNRMMQVGTIFKYHLVAGIIIYRIVEVKKFYVYYLLL